MSDEDEYCWSHHDDWDWTPGKDGNDRGMFGPRLDEDGTAGWTPEYTEKWLRKNNERARKTEEQRKMMNEMKQAGACEKENCVEIPSPDYRNRPKVEMSPYSLSTGSKEVFVFADKARKILREAFGGLSETDKDVLRKMVTKGMGNVDPEGESLLAVVGRTESLLDRIIRTVTDGYTVQTFEIWREGFEDEDGKEPAVLLAKDIPGSDFADAVEFWYSSTVDAEHIYGPLVWRGGGCEGKRKYWLWGCRLYDNEQDARRRFG